MADDDMRDSLVLAALRQLSDDDAARHLHECEAFNVFFGAGLIGTDDLRLALQMEALQRRYPEAGNPDPTWVAWAAWAEVARLREVTASLDFAPP